MRNTVLMSLNLLLAVIVSAATNVRSPLRNRSAIGDSSANEMVDKEIVAAGVTNERVLRAMRDTPRHEFVPQNQRQYAYFDMALPIGDAQTISPPFVVAYMTQELDPQPTDRVLEIGTGSGYQAAVLSPLVKDVYTIEIVEALGRRAERTLKRLDYNNVYARVGDGYQGWPEAAPFDKIIVTCSPEKVPQPLVDQLRDGGLMVIPVGERYQQTLYRLRKRRQRAGKSEALRPTLFVPMTGAAEERRVVLPDPSQAANRQRRLRRNATGRERGNERTCPNPAGWHYQRQLTLVTGAPHAPDGKAFARFHNDEPGRGCQALQGFAVDGRKVSALKLSLAGEGRKHSPRSASEPMAASRRLVLRRAPGRGRRRIDRPVPRHIRLASRKNEQIRVPLRAREAILRIGLLGAVGELSLDDVQVRAAE